MLVLSSITLLIKIIEGKAGDRIAQFVVYTNHDVTVSEGEVVDSDRGEKGFGSSGK